MRLVFLIPLALIGGTTLVLTSLWLLLKALFGEEILP